MRQWKKREYGWRGQRINHAGHNLQWKTNGLRDRWDGLTFEITRRNQSPRKMNRYTESAKINLSSNDNDSIRPNMGDEVPFPFSPRPSSAPVSITETWKEIDDIKNLQLSPDQGRRSHDISTDKSLTLLPINSLKRGAVAESDSSETFFNTANYRLASNRRIKTLFGGPFVNKEKSPDFRRKIVSPNESNTDRNSNGSVKRLFDSNKDNPNSMPDFRSNKHDLKTYPRRSYDHRPQTFRSKTAPRSKTASVEENGDF